MIIRNMQEKDLSQVAEIEKLIFSQPWSEKSFRDSIKDENNVYICVEVDGVIAGYCGIWNVAGEGQVNNVAVHPLYRNKGIAYQMLQYAIDMCNKKGTDSYTLEVRKSNEYAIRLYEKLGFIDCGIRKNFYDCPKEDAIIMWINPPCI